MESEIWGRDPAYVPLFGVCHRSSARPARSVGNPACHHPPTKLRPVPERFSIAQVTPHPWEDEHEVNAFAGELANELAGRGHRVLVLAPTRSPQLVRDSRKLIRSARERPEALFDPEGGVRVLGVGELLPLQRRGGAPSPPVDISRTIEEVLALAPLDFLHVHEPFAPSASSVALRHSRALNVGSFHAPTERVLSTQVARRFVELFFGRLDARTASFRATRDVMEHFFPASYRLLQAGRRERRAAGLRRSAPVRVLRPGGTPGAAAVPARAAAAARRARLARHGVLAHRRGAHGRAAQPSQGPPDDLLGGRHERERGAGQRGRRGRGQPRPGARPRAARPSARSRRRPGRPAAARLRGGGRGRPAVRARRRRRARRSARASPARAGAARGAARAPAGPLVEPRGRRGGGDLRRARRPAPPGRRAQARGAGAARQAPDDRRRHPHAHRPLERLRDARRGAARHRAPSAASARSR